MRDVVAMVLAGGRVHELSALTMIRTKAAVPFGGQYRLIDFALSSLMHSDIERVGVLSLYRPSSLIDHVGIGEPWDLVGRGRGVKILPPYLGKGGDQWYRGTADAVYRNLSFIRDHGPREVLVCSGDHIYSMDFRPFLRQHRETGADLTMVVKAIAPETGRGRFGFAEVDAQSRVVGYEEKPAIPRSDLASLTIYLFRTEILIERLEENHRQGSSLQLYSEVLPEMVKRDRVVAYPHPGYWNYARSVDAYHQAHMDLLGYNPPIDLGRWGVRSRKTLSGLGDLAPAVFGQEGLCRDSIVCPGAQIEGEVLRSVVGPGVIIEKGAKVSQSVLMQDTVVRAGAQVDRAVLDKQVVVGASAQVGTGKTNGANRSSPEGLTGGVSVVGKKSIVPAGARVGRNCVIHPELTAAHWPTTDLASGESLFAPGEDEEP